MARLVYIPNRVLDLNGVADGASIYVYQSGTTTKITLYADAAYSVPVSNPYVVAAGAAVPPLYYNYGGNIRMYVVSLSGEIQDTDPYLPLLTTDDVSDLITPEKFGAVGDGVTDDHVALQAWLDNGGSLFLPRKKYHSSTQLIIRKCVHINGTSFGFDARQAGYAAMPGSRIHFAAGVGGLDIQPQWTTTTYPAPSPNQEGGAVSVIENIGLIGSGGATAVGVHCRTIAHLRNVQVLQFSGDGFDISGGASAGNNGETGNTDLVTLESCVAQENGGHGFHLRGTDANVIKLDTCNAPSNTGWGFYDEAEFANCYLNCHASSNVAGSYKATSAVAAHTYTNCYVEGAFNSQMDISYPAVLVGGMAGTAGTTGNTHSGGPKPITLGSVYSYVPVINFQHDTWGFEGAITASEARAYHGLSTGLSLQGYGTSYDVTLINQSGAVAAGIPAGTTTFGFLGSMGYVTGAGGAVTQATNKSTGVTLNKPCGQITLNSASLAASTVVSFTFTNSTIAATDVIRINVASAGTAGAYLVQADQMSAGSCRISIRNLTAGALAEALVINFAVIKAVNA